jgi:hypothetical protein
MDEVKHHSPDGEYYYSGSTPPTVTCGGSDTITVDATTPRCRPLMNPLFRSLTYESRDG